MQSDYGWGLPVNVSADAGALDGLMYAVHGLIAVLFAGWFVFFVITLVRFRQNARRRPPGSIPPKIPAALEGGILIFELVLLAAFSVPIFYKLQQQKPPADTAVQIRVVAQQYAWNVHYPGPDGVFGMTAPEFVTDFNPVGLNPEDERGRDDIVSLNEMHVPVHTRVAVMLSSKDVIHGFSIPVMRIKQDVTPGQTITLGLEANRTGQFEIACAQLCGLGHYRMKGLFVVDAPEDYAAWLKKMGTGRS